LKQFVAVHDCHIAKNMNARCYLLHNASTFPKPSHFELRRLAFPAALGIGLLVISLLLAASVPRTHADSFASLSLDGPDYSPGQTVTLSGSGFIADSNVSVSVTLPDSTNSTWIAQADASGSFTTTYVADAQTGDHVFTATDGVSTASATYPDAASAILFHVGPHTAAPGADLNWQLLALCTGPSTDSQSCSAGCSSIGGLVPDGYKVSVEMQSGSTCDFGS
jgi:hypothetical protein